MSRARAALALAVTLLGVTAVPAAAVGPPTPTPVVSAPTTPAPPALQPVGGPRLTGVAPVADVPPGVPLPPGPAGTSYLLADLGSGEVLAAKGPHVRALPASTLKTLTALTVIPLLPTSRRVLAEPGDVVDGSKVGIAPGSSYSVQQLLEGMLLSSGNDAATALARAAGGVPQTVARMQQHARDLGALDTVVKDPSGLDAPGQVTSAYDLALIARAALRLPTFRQVVTTKRVRFPGASRPGAVRTSYEIQNHNSLLFNYPGAIGVKNGYTVAARWTIVGAATRGSRTYVVTALTRTDRSWRPTAALLDWAFRYGQRVRPVGRLVDPGEATAIGPAPPSATSPALPTDPPTDPPSGPVGEGGAGAAGDGQAVAAGPAARSQGLLASSGVRTGVGVGGLSAAALLVLVMALSASARRRRLRAARAARSARRAPRSVP